MFYLCQGKVVRKQRFLECNKKGRGIIEIGREKEKKKIVMKCVFGESFQKGSHHDRFFLFIPYIFADGPILYHHLLSISTISVCPDASVFAGFTTIIISVHYICPFKHPPQLFLLFCSMAIPAQSSSSRIITNTI